MEKDFYNVEESKHSKLINNLKDLPQIKTPDNFEYNLMVRIQNRDFEKEGAEAPQRGISRYLIPAFSLALTAVVLFFVFSPESSEINPLMIDPPAIASNGAAALETGSKLRSNENDVVLKREETNKSRSGKTVSPNVAANSKDAVVQQNPPYPLISRNNVSIDDYLTGSKSNRSGINSRSALVNSGNSQSDFEGFLIPQNPDPKLIQRYRAMLDSVKKARAKEDSLRAKINSSNLK